MDAVTERRRALGDFVRAHREALDPAAAGLAGGRRRTPGLRREEVAQRAGLSTTWYSWIEQGREVSASPGALARLAVALQLGRAERAYLFELAGKRDPEPGGDAAEPLPPAVAACVAAITAPAYVLDGLWTARAWNRPAAALFRGWLDEGGERNLLRYVFLHPAARTLIADWAVRARRVAAEFRAASGSRLDDPALRDLVAGLRRDSTEFALFWDQQGVLEREGGLRSFHHPDGERHFAQVTFDVAGHPSFSHPSFRLTMLVPADAAG